MPQVRVYLRKQNSLTENPAHRCTKSRATRLVAAYPSAFFFDPTALTLRLLTDVSWTKLLSGLREPIKAERVEIKDSGHPIMLSYPPARQETNGARLQRELWLRAERF